MRIYIKGGTWRNTEDEILKAAVMKYGKNQWARIASLLSRKSAKQCKTRWLEWLDPSIKKTEWTREEEEKLLHLAKLMPNQWRSIAPIVGRTAYQCLEHYEKLLDQAQDRDEDYDPSEDPRRLRPGEIDPHPECKPARPDPVDMDEDEKEMLSEARARIANNQGKKAKRKAREKQLEEARRLASLQKKRELKAAGIDVSKHKRRLRGMDYNREVPFERQVPKGFYDVSEENQEAREIKDKSHFRGVSLQQLEGGKTRQEVEEELQAKDRKRQREKEKRNLPETIMQKNRLHDISQMHKRTKLSMPEPQITDKELEEIAKVGAIPSDLPQQSGNSATAKLLADYSSSMNTPMRTPRTPAQLDTVMLEAQNLRALTTAQTPLKGGQNTPLHSTFNDFGGVTPKKSVVMTPNPLAGSLTPTRTPGASSASVAGSSTPLSVRDQLHINPDDVGDLTFSAREEKHRQTQLKSQLESSLQGLPSPKYKYKTVAPKSGADGSEHDVADDLEIDASDLEAMRIRQRRQREEYLLSLRSTVLKKELPRPKTLDFSILASSSIAKGVLHEEKLKKSTIYKLDRTILRSLPDIQQAQELVEFEMFQLLKNDEETYPQQPQQSKKSAKSSAPTVSFQPPTINVDLSLDELTDAKLLIEEQLDRDKLPEEEQFEQAWDGYADELIFVPKQRRFGRASTLSNTAQLEAYEFYFEKLRELLGNEIKKSAKLENKMNIVTAGYIKRSNTLQQDIENFYTQIDEANIELESFKMLHQLESKAIPKRIKQLKEEVEEQVKREHQLQLRYSNLLSEIQEYEKLLKSISTTASSATTTTTTPTNTTAVTTQ